MRCACCILCDDSENLVKKNKNTVTLLILDISEFSACLVSRLVLSYDLPCMSHLNNICSMEYRDRCLI